MGDQTNGRDGAPLTANEFLDRELQRSHSEEPGPAVSSKPPEKAPAPRLQINYKGRMIDLEMEKAAALAAKGYHYEDSMRALKEEREALRVDREMYPQYREYREYLAKRPDLAQAIGGLIDRYEQTGSVGLPPPATIEEDEQRAAVPPAFRKVLDDARAATDKIKRHFEEQEERQLRDRVVTQATEAIANRPALRLASNLLYQRTGRDIALERLVQGALEPGSNVEALADALASEYGPLVSETLGVRDGQFRSESPAAAPAGTAKPEQRKAFDAADMKSGAVRRAAQAFIDGLT